MRTKSGFVLENNATEQRAGQQKGSYTHGLSPTPRNASSTPFMAATAGGGAGTGAAAGEQELAGNGSSLHSRLRRSCCSASSAQLTGFSFIADKKLASNFYPGILSGKKNGELTKKGKGEQAAGNLLVEQALHCTGPLHSFREQRREEGGGGERQWWAGPHHPTRSPLPLSARGQKGPCFAFKS